MAEKKPEESFSAEQTQERFAAALLGPRKVGHKSIETVREQVKATSQGRKICPECDHVFQGSGWDGIDAHWKSRHEKIMPYEEAWPLIKSGKYRSSK